jgi:hypothetical protein
MTVQTTTRNATLQDLVALLKDHQSRKIDMVIPANTLRANQANLIVEGAGQEITEDGVTTVDGIYRPTDVADEGLANKLKIPSAYLKRLRAERPDLYDVNVNGWLHGNPDPQPEEHDGGVHMIHGPNFVGPDSRKFLLRAFRGDDGGEGVARAFLSDRYGIIDNFDVLVAAMKGIQQSGAQATIDRCDLSDRKMYVRVSAPDVAVMAPELLRGYRSPFSGQSGDELPIVHAGFVISNSEVGNGSYTLIPQVVVQVCSNGMTRTVDAMRRTHIGERMDQGVVQWSAGTERKSLELITSMTQDAVATFLDTGYVQKVVDEVTERATKPVASDAVQEVTKRLRFTDEESAGVLDHFIRGGQVTAGGVMQAVTSFSQTVPNADRAYELEALGMEALVLVSKS